MNKQVLFLFFFLTFFPSSLFGADIQIVNLKVEYAETPLGIDVEHPRFSWQMKKASDSERGCKQTAYQLVVSDESGNIVWDSEKNNSDVSLNVDYHGEPLLASTRYDWEIHVWDSDSEKHTARSWFETGLMDSSLSAWNGAKWIGGSDQDMVLFSPYLPVFKINFSVQLEKESGATRAGFVYGANDLRLMDKHKNLYKLENAKNESYLLVEIDIAPLSSKENALLNVYRVGYHPDDKKAVPYKSYAIPATIISDDNKYEKHTISIGSDLGYTSIHIDGTGEENHIAEVALNPLGRGGDYIAFPVVGDIGFSVPEGQVATFSEVEIRNFRGPFNILFAEILNEQSYKGIFSGQKNLTVKNNSYEVRGSESGTFLVADPSKNSMPMVRTTFSSSQPKIAKARLYVTSRGIYEIYLNGNRIGDDYFNPGLTQYNETHLYQTYDVTGYIQPGENALGAMLGEGWWSGGATYLGESWNFFGDRQSLLAKLVISYVDGNEDVIVSNPSTWSYYNDGPVIYGSFFQGEVYNALKESQVDGWSTASYDASNWKPAREVGLAGNVHNDIFRNRVGGEDMMEVPITGQFGRTAKKVKELRAISYEEVRPGVFVYDMGQNMVGVPIISLSGMESGKKVILRFAEVKYPDLPEYAGNVGMIMLENIRAAMAQEIYITKGGNETIAPRFTFHGYRFLEITGIEAPLALEAVKGTVISSVHELASHFKTSNPKVNKLWENITWSTFGNFLSIPTDCPQRNERLGWSGDISVFARTATYLADVPQFLRRHMLAMRDLQNEDGRFPDVAPVGVGFGGLLWGSAGITVAWESYQQYDDTHMLAEHYEAMKSYIKFVFQNYIDPESNLIVQERAWSDLGDWLAPEQEKNDNSLLWEAYLVYDLEMMKKIASVLGKNDDAQEFDALYQERKKFFNETYLDQQTKKTIHSGFNQSSKAGDPTDTQTSYVLPLAFDVFQPEHKEKAIANFVATIERENKADNGTICSPYSLMTGFIGTSWINKALSDHGRTDVAYRLLQQTNFPSWLYPVEQGATTIWERLNSYTHESGFGGNNRMNSFNHYSFGAIGSWMYAYSLGIERDENSPGFKHFILQPEPDPTGKMTYAKGHYDSMYGRIESSWERKDGSYRYRFVVPANTTATLYIPAQKEQDVTENGKRAAKAKGVKYLGKKDTKEVFEVQSGDYDFLVK